MYKRQESKLADPRSVLLLAFVDGVIAGDFDLHPIGGALRLAHRAGIGVSVRRDYWRQGIADYMLQTLLDCARACGYEQVELEVVADNFRAVPLYLKHGFQVVSYTHLRARRISRATAASPRKTACCINPSTRPIPA